MTQRYVTFLRRKGKLAEVSRVFSSKLTGDVLDVGCDAKHLSNSVQGRYVGVDIAGSPDVRVNVEMGLPFKDRTFDTVVAFDILEHCDRIHFVFDELCRVSRRYVIIGLPNMYEWRFRFRYLFGRRVSSKYGLSHEPMKDRHRWLFTLEEGITFVRERSARNGFSVSEEVLGYYGSRKIMARVFRTIGKLVAPMGTSFFIYHYWSVLSRNEN